MRGLVRSQVEFPPAIICGIFLIMHLPVHINLGLAETTEMSNVNQYLSSIPGEKVKRFVFICRFAK